MKTKIILFQDFQAQRFEPLTLTRPIYDLKIGTRSNAQRFKDVYQSHEIGLFAPNYLRDLLYTKYVLEINTIDSDTDYILFINGRIISDTAIELSKKEEIGIQGDTISYLMIKKDNIPDNFDLTDKHIMQQIPSNIDRIQTKFFEIKYPWDIIKYNKDFILRDFNNFYKNKINSKLDSSVKLVKENFIFVDKNVKIGANTIIDATNGPVMILKDTIIEPFSYIKGPVFIGEKNVIKSFSQIREGSSIHYQCRIGGEVSNSIFHSFSNKAHHGFVGDSYVGKWVNIGAGTSTSNLKNNYGYINVMPKGKEKIKTDMQFLGAIIGDFSKFSINSSINSGTITGFCANSFNSGTLSKKFIPCFSWGDNDIYDLDKAIKDARKITKRRGITLSPQLETLFKYIYKNR